MTAHIVSDAPASGNLTAVISARHPGPVSAPTESRWKSSWPAIALITLRDRLFDPRVSHNHKPEIGCTHNQSRNDNHNGSQNDNHNNSVEMRRPKTDRQNISGQQNHGVRLTGGLLTGRLPLTHKIIIPAAQRGNVEQISRVINTVSE